MGVAVLDESTPTVARASLFDGPYSLRVPHETGALIASAAAAPLALLLVGLFFHGVTVSEVILLAVVGLVLVSLARGRLLGTGVHINERQFPEVFADVAEIAGRLGVEVPMVFVRDDPFEPITSVGTEHPYALVISSQYFEHLSRPELRFLLARELAHIAAGHTRVASLFRASGRENPIVSLLFGSWMRRTEYTADRVGLLFCGSPDDATSAIAITQFHSIGRRIDYEALAEQQVTLEGDGRLRLGEWSSAVPFATSRLKALRAFAVSPLAAHWRTQIQNLDTGVTVLAKPAARGEFVRGRDCASPVLRYAAICLDLLVVMAILNSGIVLGVEHQKVDLDADASLRDVLKMFPWLAKLQGAHISVADPKLFLGFFIYCAILVALSGQTLGMMVTDIRVVTRKFERAPVLQIVWRYVVGALATMLVIPIALTFFFRIAPHDRLSRTRVIRSRLR